MLTPGSAAPDFSGTDLIGGGTFTLSDHLGDVIFLAFGAHTCGYCQIEALRLQNLWTKFQGHGVQIVFVHVGSDQAQGQAWLTGLGVTYPAIQDTSGFWASYATGDIGIPQGFIIDRDMLVHSTLYGAYPEATMEGRILDAIYHRSPVDLELVMDVSNSMNLSYTGDSKLTMMKRACHLITEFLVDHGQTADRMGLVWFSDTAEEYTTTTGDKLVPVLGNGAALQGQINAHATGTCTAMGAGLQTAFDNLSMSTHQRAVILCTDGMQNIQPKVTKVGSHFEIINNGGWECGPASGIAAHPGIDIASYDTVIHTIGIGITATYETLLQELASATNGFYLGTNDPDTDLDLIYFVDLCNCLAEGSPAVAHHSIGQLAAEQCEAVESFVINESVRKFSAIVSWPRSMPGSLSFWLYAPDGTVLDLNQEMKLSDGCAMVTVYLPVEIQGKSLSKAGQWRMIIKGETEQATAFYHAFVIVEDRGTHLILDWPRRRFDVGETFPIDIKLVEGERVIEEVLDVSVEAATPRASLPKLLGEYRAPYAKLAWPIFPKDPLIAKLKALEEDPRYERILRPRREQLSLRAGTLECSVDNQHIGIVLPLRTPGLHSYKITVECMSQKLGPVKRVSMISVYTGVGKLDPEMTLVGRLSTVRGGVSEISFTVTPKTVTGELVGPGAADHFKVMRGAEQVEIKVEDQLDGTYKVHVPTDSHGKRKTVSELRLQFLSTTVWQGEE